MNIKCKWGIHGRVVTGCGMFSDGYLCLDCGFDTYHPLIGKSYEPLRKEIWPEVEAARKKYESNIN